MCGLNGAAGTLGLQSENVFKDLLFLHALRGDHSTGAVSIGRGRDDQPNVAKCIGPPWLLMDMGRFRKDVMGGTNKVFMGHNRYATKGAISIANAHPFVFKDVFGAHNGTVYDHYIKSLPDAKYFSTDSETIINSINETSIEETIKKLNGAWALTWYDRRDNTINLLRNPARPLYFCFDKEHKALFWASELNFLDTALVRQKVDRDKPKAYWCLENVWYRWRIPEYNKPFGEVQSKTLTSAEAAHDDRPFTSGSGGKIGTGTTVSGTTDQFDKDGRFFRQDNGVYKEGNVVDIQSREHRHEELMKKHRGSKFPMLFQSSSCRVYYDTEHKKYHRYYWTQVDFTWCHSFHENPPLEIAGKPLEELLAKKIVLKLAGPEYQPPFDPNDFLRFKSSDEMLQVYKRPIAAKDPLPWVAYYWDKQRGGWTKHKDSTPPLEMPFTLLDVDANHCFHTQKARGKNPRVQYYKGFNGLKLTQEQFNLICQDGCSGCGRIPRWMHGKMGGVLVHFISKNDFICEFCGEDPGLLKTVPAKTVDATVH